MFVVYGIVDYYITGRLLLYRSIVTLPVYYYITGCNKRRYNDKGK